MDPASLIVFATALFIAAAAPGPGIVAIVARVLGRGPRGAVAFALGVGLGDLVWLALAIGGLAVIAQTFHLAFLAVKWVGIAYLLWIALRLWRAPAPGGAAALPADDRPATMLAAGLALTMGNPKVMVFYLALLPALIDTGAVGWLGFAELAAVVATVLTLVFASYIALAARARGLLAAPARVRAVNRGSALTMVGAAGWAATR